MLPAFRPGDLLLVRQVTTLRVGDVVVLEHETKRLLKRIVQIRGDRIVVEGDNKTKSVDSRRFGPVPKKEIIGKVWVHVRT